MVDPHSAPHQRAMSAPGPPHVCHPNALTTGFPLELGGSGPGPRCWGTLWTPRRGWGPLACPAPTAHPVQPPRPTPYPDSSSLPSSGSTGPWDPCGTGMGGQDPDPKPGRPPGPNRGTPAAPGRGDPDPAPSGPSIRRGQPAPDPGSQPRAGGPGARALPAITEPQRGGSQRHQDPPAPPRRLPGGRSGLVPRANPRVSRRGRAGGRPRRERSGWPSAAGAGALPAELGRALRAAARRPVRPPGTRYRRPVLRARCLPCPWVSARVRRHRKRIRMLPSRPCSGQGARGVAVTPLRRPARYRHR